MVRLIAILTANFAQEYKDAPHLCLLKSTQKRPCIAPQITGWWVPREDGAGIGDITGFDDFTREPNSPEA